MAVVSTLCHNPGQILTLSHHFVAASASQAPHPAAHQVTYSLVAEILTPRRGQVTGLDLDLVAVKRYLATMHFHSHSQKMPIGGVILPAQCEAVQTRLRDHHVGLTKIHCAHVDRDRRLDLSGLEAHLRGLMAGLWVVTGPERCMVRMVVVQEGLELEVVLREMEGLVVGADLEVWRIHLAMWVRWTRVHLVRHLRAVVGGMVLRKLEVIRFVPGVEVEVEVLLCNWVTQNGSRTGNIHLLWTRSEHGDEELLASLIVYGF